MLFLFVTPVFFGIANYFLPMMIGADDLAFPRVNAIGFWLLPPSLLLVRSGLTTEILGKFLGLLVDPAALDVLFAVAPPELGWTMYTPRSIAVANPGVDFFLLGLHLSGLSTTMAAINFVVTVFTERSEDVGLGNLNIFSWTMLTTSGIVLFAFPLLGSVILMLLLDRNFGTVFFAPQAGGPLLYQHLFWFFGHPEVYIIFLPATGLLSTILPKFCDRKLFGYRFVVYSTLALGVLSFGVWAHHMFTTGADPAVLASFMIVSIAIAVPSAIKTFNWITTMWRGSIRLAAPMLLCIGSIALFIVGGITGVFLAAIPIDVLYQDTYYVVGHFHLILMGIIPFMMFAASYYWFPILTGRTYDRRLARIQSVLLILGSAVTFLALVLLGMMGLPRRYAAYPAAYAPLQIVASAGAFVIGASVLLWLYVVAKGYFAGDPVRDADVWDLKRTKQFTREWQAFEAELMEEEGVASYPPDGFAPSSERQTEGESTSPTALEDTREMVRDGVVGVVGGLAGTALLTAVLLVAAAVGRFEFGAFAEVGALVALVLPGDGRSVVVGYLVYLFGSTTAWALLYVAIVDHIPRERGLGKGIVFGLLLLPGFALAFHPGDGWVPGVGFVLFAAVGHAAYGAALAGTFELLGTRLGSLGLPGGDG
jgi:cytochrome c oxidase subunit 1